MLSAVLIVLIVLHQSVRVAIWGWKQFSPFSVAFMMDITIFVMFGFAPINYTDVRAVFSNDASLTLFTIGGVLALYAGFYVVEALPKSRHLMTALSADALPAKLLWFGSLVFLAAVMRYEWINLVAARFNIIELISAEKIGTYGVAVNTSMEDTSGYQIIAMSYPFVLVLIARLTLSGRFWYAGVLYVIQLLAWALLSVTRMPVILAAAIPLVYVNYRVRRFGLVETACGFALFVIVLTVLNVWRVRGIEGLKDLQVEGISIDSAFHQNLAPIYGYQMLWQQQKAEAFAYEYGHTYAYIPLTFVPRVLWPEKPIVSFEPRWTVNIFNKHFSDSNEFGGVWAFTVWGEGVVQFGVVGILLNLLFYGAFVALVQRAFSQGCDTYLLSVYVYVMCAVFLRSSFSSLVVNVLVMLTPLAIAVAIFRRLRVALSQPAGMRFSHARSR